MDWSFVLFEHDPELANQAIQSGIHSVIVDCEHIGKAERQKGADTEIAPRNLSDLKPLRGIPDLKINCRINQFGEWTRNEIETAIEFGAHRIFLPLVKEINEVEQFIKQIDSRVEAAILIETDIAVKNRTELAKFPLAAVYVGLNDLAISRKSKSIFAAIADGTVERVREAFDKTQFGFAGATLLDQGSPIPSRILLKEMSRLKTHFTFLRRSWKKDSCHRDPSAEIQKIKEFLILQEKRTAIEVQRDHTQFIHFLNARGLA